MKPIRAPLGNERGMALIVALLVLTVLSVIAAAMMLSITSDRRIAMFSQHEQKALNVAEAGIAEGLERIRRGDVPNDLNPKMVTQIFLTDEGNVPVFGSTDTTALATGQPPGEWMQYSSASKGPQALTVQYKTDANRNVIYRYDSMSNPKVQTGTGDPVFVITSVGHFGGATRTLQAEVTTSSIKPNLKGAVASKEKIDLKEDANANGYDHKAETPTGTGNNGGRANAWETTRTPKAGAWSSKKVDADGSLQGSPKESENQTPFYAGPWEVLNKTQQEFYGWVGEPANEKKKQKIMENPRGISYLAKPGSKPQEAKGRFEYKGTFSGDGFLYVDGDLVIDGNFTFRGLIYVEGDITWHGSGWVLGAIVSKKKMHLHSKKNNPIQVLMSHDAITYNLGKYGGMFSTLSWRELP